MKVLAFASSLTSFEGAYLWNDYLYTTTLLLFNIGEIQPVYCLTNSASAKNDELILTEQG